MKPKQPKKALRTQQGKTMALQKISRENMLLRDAVKKSTVELEHKKRELAIESALERVRTVAMAMKKPEDMLDICRVISNELQRLGVKEIRNIQTAIVDEKKPTYLNYEYFRLHKITTITPIAYKEHKGINRFVRKILKDPESFFTNSLKGPELRNWLKYQAETGQFVDSHLRKTKSLHYYFYSIGRGALGISAYAPLNKDQINLFKRFRNVFQLSYQRFIDIQSAEAHAREAEIQLSLERVRARAMAMHKSEEVMDVAGTLFEELQKLSFTFGASSIIIMDKHSGDAEYWIAGFSKNKFPESYRVNYFKHPYHDALFSAWKKGKKYLVYTLEGKEKVAYDNVLFTETGYRNIPEDEKKLMRGIPSVTFSIAFMKHGALHWGPSSLSQDQANVLQRFAQVFEQAYTRFQDLKKAEAQAREAQIEVGLERVRAKAMAMHKSDDLNVAVSVVFEELAKLNLNVMRCGIGIMDKGRRHSDVWVTTITDEGPVVQVSGDESFDIHPLLSKAFDDWLEGKPESSYTLEGQDLVNYYSALGQTNFHLPESQLKLSINASEKQYYYLATFEAGGLFAFRKDPFPGEAKEVMRRFASVFNLTYNRFLDIQKAEAQAREAQIEVSLERVRAKAMAMHNSEEIATTITTFYHEIEMLSVTPIRCGVALVDKETKIAEVATMNTTESGETRVLMGHFKNVGHRILEGAFDHWLQHKEYHATLRGSEISEYYKVLRLQIDFPEYPHDEVQHGYYFMFREGWVYAWTAKPLTEEQLKIYRRFTTVLSLTFKRYNDLKQAEAQAREAKIEAALEKVRSRSLAMHTADELGEVITVIVDKLKELNFSVNDGVALITYINGSKDLIEWMENPGFPSAIKFYLPYFKHPVFTNLWKAKEKGLEFAATKYTAEENRSFLEHIFEHSDYKHTPQPVKDYCLAASSYSTYIAFQKYTSIFINDYSEKPLTEQEIDILKRFSKVFEQAYIRFLDLEKAEAQAEQAKLDLIQIQTARKKAEDALTALRATQTQLIQSEKMASLGELTAGIAHEIQNPLNFVNNFSEVSNELIEEMKEQLEKGHKDVAIQLVEDVKQNLNKINLHGKRADAIVKSMLQHSRRSSGQKELTDINVLADEYLRLAYHGFRAKDQSFNAKFEIRLDDTLGKINVVPQEIGRVILNLVNNAFYAVSEKKQKNLPGYEPMVTVSTRKNNDHTEIKVVDNGNGIPAQVLDKIFQPFFTTKPTGQGTGLGLSLSYDIITKGHGGELKVRTREGEGSEFVIELPAQ